MWSVQFFTPKQRDWLINLSIKKYYLYWIMIQLMPSQLVKYCLYTYYRHLKDSLLGFGPILSLFETNWAQTTRTHNWWKYKLSLWLLVKMCVVVTDRNVGAVFGKIIYGASVNILLLNVLRFLVRRWWLTPNISAFLSNTMLNHSECRVLSVDNWIFPYHLPFSSPSGSYKNTSGQGDNGTEDSWA